MTIEMFVNSGDLPKGPANPKSFSDRELEKVGIRILDALKVRLLCERCGALWVPKTGHRGRFARGYWKCPNGCNRGGARPEESSL